MAIDLTLDDDQLLLQRSANELFQQRYPSDVVRAIEAGDLGYSPERWREMAGLGWLGITLPRGYGGGGGSFLDLYPDLRGDGALPGAEPAPRHRRGRGRDRSSRPGPTSSSGALLPAIAQRRLHRQPRDPRGRRLVRARRRSPARRSGAAATTSSTRDQAARAVRALGGPLPRPRCAPATAGAEGISLFLVDAHADGVSCEPIRNIAGHALYAVTVRRRGRAGRQPRRGRTAAGRRLSAATLKAAVLQTATIVGAAQAVLDMTNQYAKDREQFGSPIGRYQAVQYLVTDILIDMHRADLLAKQAAFRIDAGKPFEREAAIAVAFGKQAAAHLHRQAHEVHAGVAFILEHDLHALLAALEVLGEQPRRRPLLPGARGGFNGGLTGGPLHVRGAQARSPECRWTQRLQPRRRLRGLR